MDFFSFLKRKKLVAGCGHKTKIKDTILVFGKNEEFKLSIKKGETPYCHRCIEKMTIKCAWCGEPIIIGDPITFHTPTDKNFKIPDYAVVYRENPLLLIGCLRWKCTLTGANRTGFLGPGKKVFPMFSPIEQTTRNGKTITEKT